MLSNLAMCFRLAWIAAVDASMVLCIARISTLTTERAGPQVGDKGAARNKDNGQPVNVHGMGKSITDIFILENLPVLIEPQTHGRLLGVIEKPYPIHIAVFNYRRIAFDMPVIGKRDWKDINLGFFKDALLAVVRMMSG